MARDDAWSEMTSRHTAMWGAARVNALRRAHVLIAGVGGVGGYLADLLIRLGVGGLTLVDYDKVELSNLNRQILFTAADIGRYKAEAAAERLAAIVEPENGGPGADLTALNLNLTDAAALVEIAAYASRREVSCHAVCLDNPEAIHAFAGALPPDALLIRPGFFNGPYDLYERSSAELKEYAIRQGAVAVLARDNAEYSFLDAACPKRNPAPSCPQIVAVTAIGMSWRIMQALWK